MRVYCAACHADFPDLETMPECCPTCQSEQLLELVEGDHPLTPYELTANDEKLLKDRGIKK